MSRFDAFVSYSHKDEPVVKPLVEMLSLNDRKVFWDGQLKPGELWDDVIQSSVKDASVFVLFWCCDTHASEYVAKEVALALRLKKKIVPVKLCHAAMPAPLNAWQWISLQGRVQHACASVDHALPGTPFAVEEPARRGRRGWLWVPSVVGLLALIFFAATLVRYKIPKSDDSENGPHNQPTATDPLHPPTPRWPRNTIPLRNGCAIVRPPESHSGSIDEFDNSGNFVDTYDIPLLAPKPPDLDLQERPLPSWYTHHQTILWATALVTSFVLLISIMVRRRQRTAETLSLTLGYLKQLQGER